MHKTSWMQLAVFVTAALVASVDVGNTDRKTLPDAGAPSAWTTIGQTTASFALNHDVFVVQGPSENVRRIKFKTTNAPLDLVRLVVRYDTGHDEHIAVSQRIPKDGESRVIELVGAGDRSVRRIEYWYVAAGVVEGRAEITWLGM